MTQKSKLGKLGEDVACRYLKKERYKVVERNFQKPWGEIDIIAVSPEKVLVFVEVKTVSGPDPTITAEDQATRAKLERVRKTAQSYANSHPEFVTEKGWRVDLVAVTVDGDEAAIKQYENI